MNESWSEQARSGFTLPGFCFLMGILTAPLLAQPPTIGTIAFNGNTALSTREIHSELSLEAGQPLVRSVLEEQLNRLKERYIGEGYLLVSVVPVLEFSADSSSVALTVTIAENSLFVIDSVYWSGVSAFSNEELDGLLGLAYGTPFSSAALERGIQQVLVGYEARGFPLAAIAVRNLVFSADDEPRRVKVFLSVSEGSQARIEGVRIEGNTSTKEHVIVRELRLEGGDLYTDVLAQRWQQRLQRLGLFASVSRPEFYLTESGAGRLLIRVREGPVNRFDGLLGYVPSDPAAGGGYLAGFADIHLRNLFGTGRMLSTRWARESPSTQDLSLRYREPWVASWPVNVELGFAQRKQDSTYVRRSFDVGVTLMVTEELTLGISFSQTNVFPSERLNNPVASGRDLNVGGVVRYDARDDPTNPQSGVLYATSYEWGSKTITVAGKESGDRTGRLTFDVEYYLSPLSRQVLAASIHGRDFQSSLVEQSDLFRLGGTLSLRGYREGQFLGSRILWSSVEYRFLFGRRSFAYGFLDAGSVTVPDRPSAGLVRAEFTRFGYGVGLRIDSGVGLIGVNLAFGEGDTFRTAKLHFRLINEF